jgi:hypothetical protein
MVTPAFDVSATLSLLKNHFLNRTDYLAVLAPWEKPCPVEPPGGIDALLLAHLLGDEAPEAKVRYDSKHGSGAMKGRFRVGSYCPSADDTTKWLCLDFDGAGHADALADPMAAALEAMKAFAVKQLPAYLELSGSGKGWHVWCFFEPAVPAAIARQIGHALAPKNAPLARGGAFADPRSARGIEVFPKQTKVKQQGFGNLVWLPWWKNAADGGNTFYRLTEAGEPEPFHPTVIDTVSDEMAIAVAKTISPTVEEPGFITPIMASPTDATWSAWRDNALRAFSLDAIYGQWLTGARAGDGWLECRDPSSSSGDKNPSASVADGSGDAERGAFHSFISGKTISVFDFLVEYCGITDFRAAREHVAKLSGVTLPTSTSTKAVETASKGRPEIQLNNRQLRDVIADTWQAVGQGNSKPYAFLCGGRMVRLFRADDDCTIEAMDEDSSKTFLALIANWVRVTKNDCVDTSPSKEIARAVISSPSSELPPLEAVVSSPVFDGDGRLIATPGYHRPGRLWFHNRAGLHIAEVEPQPSQRAVSDAKRMLLDELLGDFPFSEESDKAHMMAAILLPFARRLISGVTPLHLIEAPIAGSGKGLLVNVLAAVATGTPAAGGPLPEDDDEVRKKISSELIAGRSLVIFDNADNKKRLDSASLASALTMPVWQDRLLGQTKMLSIPNRAVWVLTGNNIQLTTEIARRCLRVRIDPGTDRPWLRKGFRHPSLIDWVLEHRSELIHAALTLIQNWLAQGKPKGNERLGSFERWSDVMGGILAANGIPGFLANLESLYEDADEEGAMWREFIAAWWDKFGDGWVGASELLTLAIERDVLGSLIGDKSLQSQKIRLGKVLSTARGRVFGSWRVLIGRNTNTKTSQYRLSPNNGGNHVHHNGSTLKCNGQLTLEAQL